MKLRNTLACAFAVLAVAGGAAGTAQAAGDDVSTFDNSDQILSCDVVEILDQPNLGPSDNNTDCSENNRSQESELVRVVGDVLVPRS